MLNFVFMLNFLLLIKDILQDIAVF